MLILRNTGLFALLLIFLVWNSFSVYAVNQENFSFEQLKGYQVNFDYDNYPEERGMIYKFYLSRYNYNPDETSINFPFLESNLGIDFFDVDNDGKKEILVYLNNPGWCGSAGCNFDIFKTERDTVVPYTWGCKQPYTTSLNVYDNVKILETNTKGYHDIGFGEYETIWKWSGKCYEMVSKSYNASR